MIDWRAGSCVSDRGPEEPQMAAETATANGNVNSLSRILRILNGETARKTATCEEFCENLSGHGHGEWRTDRSLSFAVAVPKALQLPLPDP